MLQSASPARKGRKEKSKRATDMDVGTSAPSFETVEPSHLDALNAFYGRRTPVELVIGGKAFRFEPAWLPSPPAGRTATIGLTIGASTGTLHVPQSLLERYLLRADPAADLARIQPEHAVLLLESLLAGELAWLEQRMGEWIILGPADAGPVGTGLLRLPFLLRSGEEKFGCAVHFADHQQASQFARLLDLADAEPQSAPADLPIAASLYRAAVELTYGELSSLRPGDVLIPEGPEADTALLAVADMYVAPVALDDAGGYLTAGFRRFNDSIWKWMMVDKKVPEPGLGLEDADLDALPVTLVFELGRTALTVSDLKQLGPGAVVPLPEVRNETVDLVANGKRIGRGEIVRIGESLGIRIIGIFGNA